ncbi:MAG: radical SAM protein [Nitrospirota bacterium]|jgi:radical SAM protein with 4Fe4S-binding SPASM domain
MHSPLRFVPDIFLKRRPIHLTVFLTRRCNARCPFCFYSDDDEDAASSELSLRELERLASSLGPLLWLAFSGGEVFLRKDIAEVSRAFYERNSPSIMLFSTNALMPDLIRERTEEIIRACPRSVVAVKLSLDGVGERHDALRGVPGSFNKVLGTYEALKGLLDVYGNFELGVNTVFCAENQDNMDEIIEFVRTLDRIKTHTVSLVRGSTREEGSKDVDLDKYLETIEKLETDLKRGKAPMYSFRGARLKAAQDILQRRTIYRTMKENACQLPCYAGRLNLVVTETGGVYPCETFEEGLRMGSLRDQGGDLKKVLESPRARDVVSRIEKGCFCSHECYTMTNILFNPRMYPRLVKEYLAV